MLHQAANGEYEPLWIIEEYIRTFNTTTSDIRYLKSTHHTIIDLAQIQPQGLLR